MEFPLSFSTICPAKINLGLRVHHRRPADGYHYISSIFIPISFGDTLAIEAAPGLEDSLESKVELPPAAARDYLAVSESGDLSQNILWKILQKTLALRNGEGLRLRLTKRIPTGGGLGGGSSNAGALLRYLENRYSIPRSEVRDLAIEAGADVPFFLEEGAQLVFGTGEICKPVSVGSGLGVLAISGIAVDTQKAYQLLKRTLQSAPPPKSMQGLDANALAALGSSDWRALRHLRNDFEEPVFALHPELKEIKSSFLAKGADLAFMSGSGSVVYGLVSGEDRQRALIDSMQERFSDYRFVSFSF